MSTPKSGHRRGPDSAAQPTYSISATTDGMLAEWGARTLWPANPPGRPAPDGPHPLLILAASRQKQANAVRATVRRIVNGRSKQVMVKITGGKGNGMKAIGAHLRYISRLGRGELRGTDKSLDVEDEHGHIHRTADELKALRESWQNGGTYIPDETKRREAYNIIFSMPVGTPHAALRQAVRTTARQLFKNHKYVMVLHTDQGAPHVHVMVRAESAHGTRLNPRKGDLERWRATFAASLQDLGVDAITTRQATRLQSRRPHRQWETKTSAREFDRADPTRQRSTPGAIEVRQRAAHNWEQLASDLARSPDPKDHQLAAEVRAFLNANPIPTPAGGKSLATSKPRTANNHERAHIAAQHDLHRRAAALQKSYAGQLAERQAAQPFSGMRELSSLHVVPNGQRTQVLLQSHTRDRLDRDRRPDPDMRR